MTWLQSFLSEHHKAKCQHPRICVNYNRDTYEIQYEACKVTRRYFNTLIRRMKRHLENHKMLVGKEEAVVANNNAKDVKVTKTDDKVEAAYEANEVLAYEE